MKKSASFLMLLGCFLISQECLALRCGNRLVSEGDSTTQVLARCGEPQARDNQQREIVERIGGEYVRRVYGEIEQWVYDFGSSRLVQVLSFENNRLTRIDSGGYGGYKLNPQACQDSNAYLSFRETQAQVLLKCGAPQWKGYEEESRRILKNGPYNEYLKSSVEIWHYQYNPDKSLRILKFRDGALTENYVQ